MQSESVIFGRYLKGNESRSANFGVRNWLGGMFGCPHKEMSRPFSREGETYRVCVRCGARREFLESTWETRGPFYFRGAEAPEVEAAIKPRKIIPRPTLVMKTVA